MNHDEDTEVHECAHDAQVRLGEYLTSSIRQELNRTQGTATCLLTVLTFVGSATAAGLSATAPARAGGMSPLIPTLTLAGAGLILGAALVAILAALRPQLPKPGTVPTGWPRMKSRHTEALFAHDAAEYPEFLRQDAETLAGIAYRKFDKIRAAYDLTIVGLPLLILGLLLWF